MQNAKKQPAAPLEHVSRQVRRAAARADRKKAERPGPHRALQNMVQNRIGGPGSFERHVLTLSNVRDAVERTFHFTKGHRQRRVAI